MSRKSIRSVGQQPIPRILQPRFRKKKSISLDDMEAEIVLVKEDFENTFQERYGKLKRASELGKEEALVRELNGLSLMKPNPSKSNLELFFPRKVHLRPESHLSSCSSTTSLLISEEEWQTRMAAVEKTMMEMRDYVIRNINNDCLEPWKIPPEVFSENDHMKGVPHELEELQFPDPNTKSQIKEEMTVLDAKYMEKVADVKDHLKEMTDLDGWSSDDHQIFCYIHNSFPKLEYSHRKFGLDILKRVLPTKSYNDLLKHEHWCTTNFILVEKFHTLMQCWERDKDEMLDEAIRSCHKLWEAHRNEQAASLQRVRQKALCKNLCRKVEEMRKKKLEELQEQMERMQKEKVKAERKIKEEEEKDRIRRKMMKGDIAKYKIAKLQKIQQQQALLEEHLLIMKMHLHEQKEINKERVYFRHKKRKEKLLKVKEREKERNEKEEKRRQQLEALKKLVQVKADRDPTRLLRDTKATKSHREEEKEVQLQTALFPVHSFTAQTLAEDKRFRLETKLRDAGLLNTAYAREILSQTRAFKDPRPDMFSTFNLASK